MLKVFISATAAILLLGYARSEAQTCPSYTYTLTNGQTADATQVMGDFNQILNCINTNLAPLVNPRFTGSVGIGTTSTVGILTVNAAQDHALNLRGDPTSFGYPSNLYGPILQGVSTNQTAQEPVTIVGSTVNLMGLVGIQTVSPTMTLQVNGYAGGPYAWMTPSDARLKRDVTSISGAMSILQKVRGVRYQWRSVDERDVGKDLNLPTGEPELGFVAQELQAAIPEAVVAPRDSNGVYGIKEADLIPILVEAVKEQQAQIEKLNSELVSLRTSR